MSHHSKSEVLNMIIRQESSLKGKLTESLKFSPLLHSPLFLTRQTPLVWQNMRRVETSEELWLHLQEVEVKVCWDFNIKKYICILWLAKETNIVTVSDYHCNLIKVYGNCRRKNIFYI